MKYWLLLNVFLLLSAQGWAAIPSAQESTHIRIEQVLGYTQPFENKSLLETSPELQEFFTQHIWPVLVQHLLERFAPPLTTPTRLLHHILNSPVPMTFPQQVSHPLSSSDPEWAYLRTQTRDALTPSPQSSWASRLRTFEIFALQQALLHFLKTYPHSTSWLADNLEHHRLFKDLAPNTLPLTTTQALTRDLTRLLRAYLDQELITLTPPVEQQLHLAKALFREFLLKLNPEKKLWQFEHTPLSDIQTLGKAVLEELSADLFSDTAVRETLEALSPFTGDTHPLTDVPMAVGRIAHALRTQLLQGSCYHVDPQNWTLDLDRSLLPLTLHYGFTTTDPCPQHLAQVLTATSAIFQSWMADVFQHTDRLPHSLSALFQAVSLFRLSKTVIESDEPSPPPLLMTVVERLSQSIYAHASDLDPELQGVLAPVLDRWNRFQQNRTLSLDSLPPPPIQVVFTLEDVLASLDLEHSQSPSAHQNQEEDPTLTLQFCMPLIRSVDFDSENYTAALRHHMDTLAPCTTLQQLDPADYFRCLVHTDPQAYGLMLSAVTQAITRLETTHTELLCTTLNLSLQIATTHTAEFSPTSNSSNTLTLQWQDQVTLIDSPLQAGFNIQPEQWPFLQLWESENSTSTHPVPTKPNQQLSWALHNNGASQDLLTQTITQVCFDGLTFPLQLTPGVFHLTQTGDFRPMSFSIGSQKFSAPFPPYIQLTPSAQTIHLPEHTLLWSPADSPTLQHAGELALTRHPPVSVTDIFPILNKPSNDWTPEEQAALAAYRVQEQDLSSLKSFFQAQPLATLSALQKNMTHPTLTYDPQLIKTMKTITTQRHQEDLKTQQDKLTQSISDIQRPLQDIQDVLQDMAAITQSTPLIPLSQVLATHQPTLKRLSDWIQHTSGFEAMIKHLCSFTPCATSPESILAIAVLDHGLRYPHPHDTTTPDQAHPEHAHRDDVFTPICKFWNDALSIQDQLAQQLSALQAEEKRLSVIFEKGSGF